MAQLSDNFSKTDAASISTHLNDLPNIIASQTDAKLEHLRADLIKEVISEGKKLAAQKQFADAVDASEAAAILTEVARENHSPADPQFFRDAIQKVNYVESVSEGPSVLAHPVYQVRVALASYRSALETPPSLPNTAKNVHKPLTEQQLLHQMARSNTVYHWSGDPGVPFFILEYPVASLATASEIDNGVFADGWMTLDGFRLIGTTFINTHITYNGGVTELKGVKFVNCTFSIVPNARGVALTEYITLAKFSVHFG